ncbi:MAG: DUF1295 domain-containing protein, partial [Bacteroidales bacterium]
PIGCEDGPRCGPTRGRSIRCTPAGRPCFRKNPAHKGKSITRGLWRYSRHPNYSGEILTWWGLFLFAMATGPSAWWTIIGPVSITLMFIFASIPMIERRHMERRTDYLDYKLSTSMLFPLKFR